MIRFEAELSIKSLEDMIKNVKNYKEKLNSSLYDINSAIAEEALSRAKSYVKIDTGNLSNSIQKEVTKEYARVYTNEEYAKYVEFGTGVVGKDNSHPKAAEKGWRYDVNSHGEKGWVYTKNGEDFYWTKGQKAQKFMWQAFLDTKGRMKIIAKRVLKNKGLI